jgi:hypothetical protein
MLCGFFLSLSLFAQGPDGIEYSESQKFHWGMFRGRINPKHIAEMGKNTGAVTVSSLSYSTVKFTPTSVVLKVSAKFHPHESWTRYPKLRNPGHALNHEKRHFDLCEVYARKLRQRISETRFTRRNLNTQLKTIFAEMTSEHSAEQSKYDHETEHSIDPEQQLVWNKIIDHRLAELSDYEDTIVVVPLN